MICSPSRSRSLGLGADYLPPRSKSAPGLHKGSLHTYEALRLVLSSRTFRTILAQGRFEEIVVRLGEPEEHTSAFAWPLPATKCAGQVFHRALLSDLQGGQLLPRLAFFGDDHQLRPADL